MSMIFLHVGIDAALLSRGLLSGVLTALMVVVCAAWGIRCLRRMPDLTVRFGLARA